MSDRIVVGATEVVRVEIEVADAPTDPTALVLLVTSPTGVETTYNWPTPATITKVDTGIFTRAVTATEVGVYSFRFTSTGAAASVKDGTFTVFDDVPLNTLYATLDELKAEKGIDDTVDDSLLQVALGAASRQIDNECGWRFYQDPVAVARYFHPTSPGCLDVIEVPRGQGISTSTGLTIAVDTDDNGTWETSLTINTDFTLGPLNADVDGWPWTQIDLTGVNYLFTRSMYGRPTIKITAKWGWPYVHEPIHKATLVQAQMFASSKDAAFGIAALASIDGAGMRALPWNPLARALVSPYAKPAVG